MGEELETSKLLHTLLAHSLYKVSSAEETLQTFLNPRLALLSSILSQDFEESPLIKAINVMHATISQTRSLFPSSFALAVAKTKAVSIFSDPEIVSLNYFDFEGIENWIPDEIAKFKPWIKEENNYNINDMLVNFGDRAFETFRIGASRYILDPKMTLGKLVSLRKELVHVFLEKSHARDIVAKPQIWEIWKGKAISCLESKNKEMQAIMGVTEKLAEKQYLQDSGSMLSLWTEKWGSVDISKGAKNFQNMISSLATGNVNLCASFTEVFDEWYADVANFKALLLQLPKIYDVAGDNYYDPETEDWIQQERSNACTEFESLSALLNEAVVPYSLECLFSCLSRLQSFYVSKEDNFRKVNVIIFLLRIAKQIFQRKMAESIVAQLTSLAKNLYVSFAELLLSRDDPEGRSLQSEVIVFLSSKLDKRIWEPQSPLSASHGSKTSSLEHLPESSASKSQNFAVYPVDPSVWLMQYLYSSFAEPVFNLSCEAIMMSDLGGGVNVCRNVWYSQIVMGIKNGFERARTDTTHRDNAGLVKQLNPRILSGVETADSQPDDIAKKKYDEQNIEASSNMQTEPDDEENNLPMVHDSSESLSTDADVTDVVDLLSSGVSSEEIKLIEQDSKGEKMTKDHLMQLTLDMFFVSRLLKPFNLGVDCISEIVDEVTELVRQKTLSLYYTNNRRVISRTRPQISLKPGQKTVGAGRDCFLQYLDNLDRFNPIQSFNLCKYSIKSLI